MNKIVIEELLALANLIGAAINLTSAPPIYWLVGLNVTVAVFCIVMGIIIYRNVEPEYW